MGQTPSKDVTGRTTDVTVILGAQWGDEGKGKLVDLLAGSVQIVARFNGGANAGHTLEVGGRKYAFHLLPCGMLHKGCMNVIGNGVVVHLPSLLKELDDLQEPEAVERLVISSRAHVLLDSHQRIDGDIEAEKCGGALGTTRRGIGPAYASKANRNGLRFADLIGEPSKLRQKLSEIRSFQARHYPESSAFPVTDADPELVALLAASERLRGCVKDTICFCHEALDEGKKILAEGANAALLDLDFGTYPYVTSSPTTAGGICTGLGLAPSKVKCVIGVVKAYLTRVGLGPFPTELFDKDGVHMQTVGHEYGTTTGRKRRCGWLDAQMVRYSHAINGYDSINLTKLDVLTGMAKLKIGTQYVLDGKTLPSRYMPADLDELAKIAVTYVEYDGWTEDVSKCTTFHQLPANCKAYVRAIEQHTGVPVSWVGTGPGRADMFLMPGM